MIRDYYRSAAGRAVALAEIDPAEAERDDSLEVLRGHAAQWLPELIAELPETYREAVQLSELEGLPQHEIARRLGLSLSGAKSRVQRGRALLKDVLEQCCRFEFDRRGNLIDIDPRPDRTVCRNCE